MTEALLENAIDVAGSSFVQELNTRVRHEVGSRVRGLEVSLRDGGLVLTGWAQSYHAKQVAQQCLLRVATIPLLSNDIEVARARAFGAVQATANTIYR